MKIEHWHCQSHFGEEQLDYSNILAACVGGEGQPHKYQHCDTYKGDLTLSKNPADPAHNVEAGIHYTPDGTIRSDDDAFDRELNETLNLNVPFLKKSRKETLAALQKTLEKRGNLSRATWMRLLEKWDGVAGQSNLEPYCQVIIYWIKKHLRRVSSSITS
jgi:hypothetical protein